MKVFILMSGDDYGEGWHCVSVHSTQDLADEAKAKWKLQDDYGAYWVVDHKELDPSLETIPDPYVWDDEVVHDTALDVVREVV
tara:strand:+ start:449 stop:697 length:249 start_codon:yes stop_codon:yes gene_type:complete